MLALPSFAVVLADARPAALLAPAPLAVVLADARPAALLALASYAVVLADARPAAFLALVSSAVVLADARPTALLAPAPEAVVLADARPAALLAPAPLAVVLADARPAALLALASLAVVLAHARPAALLAPGSSAVVLADARPAALLALASYAVVLADARPAAFLAPASYEVVLADARPAALFAPVSLAVVLADARPALFRGSTAACATTAHSLFVLLLLGLDRLLGQGTLPLLHSLLFAGPLDATLWLGLGHFPSLLFKILAPRRASLSVQPLSSSLDPSIARVAKPTFLTHFLGSMPGPALKLSGARTSLDSLSTFCAPLLRSASFFPVPTHLLFPLALNPFLFVCGLLNLLVCALNIAFLTNFVNVIASL